MKIYISGKISGLDEETYTTIFKQGAYQLNCEGWRYEDIINPLHINPLFGIKKWFFFMVSDLIALYRCDAIYMLYNWKNSKGARIELLFALLWNKKIYFQD